MTLAPGKLMFERRPPLFKEDRPPLRLSEFLSGDERRRQRFTRQLIARLAERGFFYLQRPRGLLRLHGLDDPWQRHLSAYQEALCTRPHPQDIIGAGSVFETGYYRTCFPDSDEMRQPIEAFMAKPHVWRGLRRHRVPPPFRNLLELTERIYRASYQTAFVLLEALEVGYGMRARALRAMFTSRRDGAVRLVKYHEPRAHTRRVIVHASRPHVDTSFFTINFGESRPGLIWIDGEKLHLLPNVAGHWLVTSGLFSHGLTRNTCRPVTPFKHTVLNDGERIVALGFVTPEGDLHNRALDEWPVPQLKRGHLNARGDDRERRRESRLSGRR